jgi:hypothetical protein
MNQYESLDLSRSDLPASNMKWFRLENNFLWRERRYPPFGPDAHYALVFLYLMVWDRTDKIHKLYVQRLRLIRPTHRATDTHYLMDRLHNIEANLADKVAEQTKKLEKSGFESEGVDVRGLAGWTLVPELQWYLKEEKRRAKHLRFMDRRDRERLKKRQARLRRSQRP